MLKGGRDCELQIILDNDPSPVSYNPVHTHQPGLTKRSDLFLYMGRKVLG